MRDISLACEQRPEFSKREFVAVRKKMVGAPVDRKEWTNE
jgi:hypothetical protein